MMERLYDCPEDCGVCVTCGDGFCHSGDGEDCATVPLIAMLPELRRRCLQPTRKAAFSAQKIAVRVQAVVIGLFRRGELCELPTRLWRLLRLRQRCLQMTNSNHC